MFIIAKIKNCWIILPRGFRHFVKYSIVGTSNAFVDFFTYFALTRSFLFFEEHYLLANGCSFVLALTWGFIWNKNWSFENRDNHKTKQYLKYFAVNVSSLLIVEAGLYVLVTLGAYDILAKVLMSLVSWGWNFSMNKYWTFKEKF